MRFTRLILALTSFLILITQTDLFASTVLHKTSMVDLSNNAIICMHQDPDGYLWIGTYDGLNLYNGKDTYVYRFELNKNVRPSRRIRYVRFEGLLLLSAGPGTHR